MIDIYVYLYIFDMDNLFDSDCIYIYEIFEQLSLGKYFDYIFESCRASLKFFFLYLQKTKYMGMCAGGGSRGQARTILIPSMGPAQFLIEAS